MNLSNPLSTYSLNKLPFHQSAVIKQLCVDASLECKLHSLGFFPGIYITCVGASPHGDPRAYLVRDSIIALRQIDSQNILVQEVSSHVKSQ